MNARRGAITVLLLAVAGTSAASVSTRTVQSLPDARPTGDHAFVSVKAVADSSVADDILQRIRTTADTWLEHRGYKLESQPRKAHTALRFLLLRRPHEGSTGEDQDIALQVWSYENGVSPTLTDVLEVFPVTTREKFFDDPDVLDRSVTYLLTTSMLGRAKSAPPPASAAEPGCWYMMGIAFDTRPMRDGLYFIKDFTKGSRAPDVGLQKLDQVIEINGKPIKDDFPPKFREGDRPTVTYIRNYQQRHVTLPLTYYCAEDPAPPK